MIENLKEEIIRLHAQICSGLADPIRILIIYTLADGTKNVSELSKLLDIPQPTVSRHLKVLREFNIVRCERMGNAMIYELKDTRFIEALDILRNILADNLEDQAALAKEANQDMKY